jgi:hypothetical protein
MGLIIKSADPSVFSFGGVFFAIVTIFLMDSCTNARLLATATEKIQPKKL